MEKNLYIGAAYYPEMWPESEIDRDIEKMKTLRLNCMRVGEFAWGKMEPSEGEFCFEWLKQAVDKLYAAGIYTIMCTPTCTPPRWMLDKYEEMRSMNSEGCREEVSSRCHPCKTSGKMREKNAIIVEELAKFFGNHPGIIGWQIDNEIYPYKDGCYCPACVKEFRIFLKQKYGTIENLNEKWGMGRWSLEYPSFDNIQPPRSGQWRHPSLRTEWIRFQCNQIISYVNEQAKIIRKYTSVPIGTDMMPTNLLGYYDINEELDVAQFNHYNTAADLPQTVFSYDFLRGVKDRPFWVTETQAGWNGSEFSDCGYRPNGNCYANTWLPIAKGGEMNLYWLFRTHRSGHELAHGALFSSSGRAYHVAEEVLRAAEDLEKCKYFLNNTHVKSKIALHYSTTSVKNFESAPLLKGFSYRNTIIEKFHESFRHHNIDVIDTAHSLDGYSVVISPFLSVADENGLKDRVLEWVRAGGKWIVGPMSDIMTDYTSKYSSSPFSFLEDMAGVYTKYQLPIANDVFKAKKTNGEPIGISTCYDAFELQGAVSLAEYDGGEFDGLSVIAERQIGKGRVIILGSVPDSKTLLELVDIEPTAQASKNISLTERIGEKRGIIAVEMENREGYIRTNGEYKELISGKIVTGQICIKPYQVLVLEKLNGR